MPRNDPGTSAPDELVEALATDPVAAARYAAMPPSHRREWDDYVVGAKQAATRRRRAAKAVAEIREPKQ